MDADVILSPGSVALIDRYARGLRHHQRDPFRHAVVSRLRGQPTYGAVEAAIQMTLGARSLFTCDAAPTERKEIDHATTSP
jgi:hypothetical protein